MIYVYCPRKSTGAFELVKELGGQRLRRFDGIDFWNKGARVRLEPNTTVVCWGTTLPPIEGVDLLNSMEESFSKFEQGKILAKKGVPTVELRNPDDHSMEAYLGAGYYPRSNYHTGGTDLLKVPDHIDFYTKKEKFTKEVRIHVFDGRSIRAGEKIPREGFKKCSEEGWKPNMDLLHPWVKSYDGGWKISYNNFESTSDMRGVAVKAVKALGLTFGAVDLGQRADGTWLVLEVNTSPGLEGGTIHSYVRAIQSWAGKE